MLCSVPSASMETSGILGLCSLLHVEAFPAKIAATTLGTYNHPNPSAGAREKHNMLLLEKEKRFEGAGERRGKSQIS